MNTRILCKNHRINSVAKSVSMKLGLLIRFIRYSCPFNFSLITARILEQRFTSVNMSFSALVTMDAFEIRAIKLIEDNTIDRLAVVFFSTITKIQQLSAIRSNSSQYIYLSILISNIMMISKVWNSLPISTFLKFYNLQDFLSSGITNTFPSYP